MKKLFLVLVVFCVAAFAYARDFEESWLVKMADYIGKGIYDIRLTFIPVEDGYVNVARKKVGGFLGIGARNVVEIIHANSNQKVDAATWYMNSWSGRDETRELAEIEALLTSKYEKRREGVWIWTKSGGFGGLGAEIYQISIKRDSSDGSARVLIERTNSGFQDRWQQLKDFLGIKP